MTEEWEFKHTNQLVGLHGSITEGKISSLGFITLDPENFCLPAEPKEEETKKSEDENQDNNDS